MKKHISLILAFILVFSVVSGLSVSADEVYDELFGLPEIKEGYHRYFLLAPEDWFWDESVTPGIFWGEGTEAPESWPGYKANKADADNVYYYDAPQDVKHIIWNNFYEGSDISGSVSRYNKRTEYIPTSDSEHQISYNRMIAVVNQGKFDDTNLNDDYPTCTWYNYYGNGRYGTQSVPEDADTYRYYFYFPDEWQCTLSSTIYIYWWNGTNAHSSYPGVEAKKTNTQGLYYYDIPKDVETICWNNGVEFNETTPENNEYRYNCYADTFNNNGKVYVLDMDKSAYHPGTGRKEYIGDWYYYYGQGEYGLTRNKTDGYYTCRSFGEGNPAPKLETYRYYFYMPEDWENVLSSSAGIYWWEGTNNCRDLWPGYTAHSTNIDGLYYYDVPKDVTSIIWTNLVEDDTWVYDAISSAAKQTANIGTEYYEAGESALYPQGLESFDNMVYVIDYDNLHTELEGTILNGEWYYYYGNGEYGTTSEKSEVFYSTRQLGTLPNYSKTRPAENEITVYFLEKFGRSPIYVNYTSNINGEEITESCELTFMASSAKGTLYYAIIPKNSETIYFSDKNRRTFDIDKYIVHNACFEFDSTVNGKYDYKSYLLDINLNKIEVLSGDTNQDGKITIQDVTAIQKHLANIKKLTGNAKKAADFNDDGKITIKDATAIQRHLAKI